jgi:hypothetical protein
LKAAPVPSDTLTGPDFERWLFDPEHRSLPDFLNMPEEAFGFVLRSYDITALRILASSHADGPPPPKHWLPSFIRLHAHGIIERLDRDDAVYFVMSPYSYEVLMHNVSYKEPLR